MAGTITFEILTLFPESFSYLSESIIKRAVESGLIKINIHNIRDWSTDKHKTVDDKPFGGGPGMLMKIQPVYDALKSLGVYPKKDPNTLVVMTSAKGIQWKQQLAKKYSQEYTKIVLLCGHYEGFDHRIAEQLIDLEISIGDYVLSGGELPAQVILDSIIRNIPGVLGNKGSLENESHNDDLEKEYPQYTRPASFETSEGEKWDVPEVLLNGNHAEIERWRAENSK
jgi:tRNA (guanine37-N1)-methyltransferase